MDIFSYESVRRIGDQNVLRKVDALKRSGLGPQGYWYNLSDPKLEQSLPVWFYFMIFTKLDLHGSVPDETTHCRFRNALVKADAYDAPLAVR
jgi:transposase, IS5 family